MARKKKVNRDAMVKEADDIIKNTEDDSAAVAFLQDTLTDDFPHLDLGRMDLHEAVDELDYDLKRKKMSGGQKAISDLNRSLDQFMAKHDEIKRKSESKKRKPKKKKKKK